MVGQITGIFGNKIIVEKNSNIKHDIINLYVKITDNEKVFVGEIIGLNKIEMEINLVGEIISGKFIYGVNKKPSFNAIVELLDESFLEILFGIKEYQPKTSLYLGNSALYENVPVFANINNLFANHLVFYTKHPYLLYYLRLLTLSVASIFYITL